MSTFYRRMGLSLLSCCLAACNGNIGSHGPTDPGGGGTAPPITGGGPTNITPGPVTVPPMPVSQTVAFSAVRKVKNLLTGMAPSDADVALVTAQGPAGLQQLIAGWMTSEPYQTALREKMVAFFRNMFQQTGFIPQEDFKLQLLEGGGFDFGGNTRTVGDDAFPRIVQNLQDSFALTAWQLVQEGRPFTDTLTTNRFVMTTALKSLYIQVEMPPDAPTFRATMPNPAWMIDYSGNSIPIEQALATMTFSDEPPALTAATAGGNTPVCRGGATAANGTFFGTSLLFQRLLGHIGQFPSSGTATCSAESAKPYFSTDDLTKWEWITIKHSAAPTDRNPAIQPYNLPALREAKELTLSLPRVGFYTTPAFLALWNTNDSNQHRVTANQALLVALGRAFTAENSIIPLSTAGLDMGHAVAGSECVGCHATLDPMRNFWANQLDFNDRNDFPTGRNNSGNPRPTAIVDEFAFGDFKATGTSISDFGGYLVPVMVAAAIVWYLLNPRRATAQDLQCAIAARDNLQYLIMSCSSAGDPLNCNVPGTYEAADIIHPTSTNMETVQVTLGGKTYGAALPWADPSVQSPTDVAMAAATVNTGKLSSATLARTAFIHHRTGTTVHGDQPKVMKLLGDIAGGDMLISSYAKHLATCFGTVQPAPIALAARGNSSELISFGGRPQPSISPTQLKQLLTGSTNDPLVKLRAIRDQSLNQLFAMAKADSSNVQMQFLDRLSTSRTQVRSLAIQLGTTLTAITQDNVQGQALAAAALFAANVTPAVTIRLAFGGDNHTDANLTNEATQTVTGVQGIQQVITALDGLTDAAGVKLSDRVTFATMNVFGRNLSGIAKVTSRAGRDHYGNHSVMVVIGKNVKPGVYGGPVTSGTAGAYSAGDMDSATGAQLNGGDIPATKSHISAARTLGAALGIPESVTTADYVAGSGGKVITAALANLP